MRLLAASAIERMAVISGMAVVPNARIAGVAFTGVHSYWAVAAMGKTLEFDRGKRILRTQEGGGARKSDEQYFHTFPHNIAFPMVAIMDSDRTKLQVAAFNRGHAGRRYWHTFPGAHWWNRHGDGPCIQAFRP
jgi:hypothetical protein